MPARHADPPRGQGGASNELTNAKDVTVSLAKTTADVTTRASGGWRAKRAALNEAKMEWGMVWDTADAGFTRQKAIPFTWGRGGVQEVA